MRIRANPKRRRPAEPRVPPVAFLRRRRTRRVAVDLSGNPCYSHSASQRTDWTRTIREVIWESYVADKIDWKHGLTCEDVEYVLENAVNEGTSRSSGHPARWGFTLSGTYAIVVFVWIETDVVEIVTAFPVDES